MYATFCPSINTPRTGASGDVYEEFPGPPTGCNQFEWTAHEPAALAEGLDAKIIEIVKRRKPLARLGQRSGQKEAVIIAFGRELFRRKKLGSATFARAVELFGRRGVLELAALMGTYAMTAVILNTVDQQLHPGQPALLPVRRSR